MLRCQGRALSGTYSVAAVAVAELGAIIKTPKHGGCRMAPTQPRPQAFTAMLMLTLTLTLAAVADAGAGAGAGADADADAYADNMMTAG